MNRYELHHGDNRAVLKTMADNSVDSIVCDPPYELGFMGKRWDASGIAYDTTLWTECLRVLKPGGHLVAFGGTRTYHRMTVAIEDAGFEIRDSILWLYATGFPKSHNLDGDWKGYGTAIKPAHEPAVLARKPLTGTVADNVLTWGVGALNIDGCRVATDDNLSGGMYSSGNHKWANPSHQWGHKRQPGQFVQPSGRWPANVILDEHAAEALDEQSGLVKGSGKATKLSRTRKGWMHTNAEFTAVEANAPDNYGDSGGASRFFYIAKASRAEREAGLDAPAGERACTHPTVKPIALMRHLVRLVTPKGGTVLDPFMGSGSTGCAAMLEGMRFVGIDITAEYVDIAERRIQHWLNQNPMEL
jgi:site-specific DNA-methyltransferase (adenine-specific)